MPLKKGLLKKRRKHNVGGFKLDAKTVKAVKYFILLVIILLALVLTIIILKGKAAV